MLNKRSPSVGIKSLNVGQSKSANLGQKNIGANNMSSNTETIIALSKTKLLLLILGACAFVVLGAWLFSLDEATIQAQRRFNDPIFVYGVGIVSIVIFGVCGIFALKKLFDKDPGLIFNSSGIVDNASGVSAGFIPWSEVVGSEILVIQKQKMLIIKVKNPEQYIERGGLLQRTLNRANYKMCASPIVISSNALKVDFSKVCDLFDQYHREYGNAVVQAG